MDSEEQPVTLTDKAVVKINEFRKDGNVPEEHGLRLSVRGGGCSGFTYDLYFDEVKPKDRTFTIKGVHVIIDEMSLMYLAGTELDYKEGMAASGFMFNNPNATGSCGCGKSVNF